MCVITWPKLIVMKNTHIFHVPFSGCFMQVNHYVIGGGESAYDVGLLRCWVILQRWSSDDSGIKLHKTRIRDIDTKLANVLRLTILHHLEAHYQRIMLTPRSERTYTYAIANPSFAITRGHSREPKYGPDMVGGHLLTNALTWWNLAELHWDYDAFGEL
jgi:hypothetical protein